MRQTSARVKRFLGGFQRRVATYKKPVACLVLSGGIAQIQAPVRTVHISLLLSFFSCESAVLLST